MKREQQVGRKAEGLDVEAGVALLKKGGRQWKCGIGTTTQIGTRVTMAKIDNPTNGSKRNRATAPPNAQAFR